MTDPTLPPFFLLFRNILFHLACGSCAQPVAVCISDSLSLTTHRLTHRSTLSLVYCAGAGGATTDVMRLHL